MHIEQFFLEGLGHQSYFVTDSKSGFAAVVDPRRDVDIYLRAAEVRDQCDSGQDALVVKVSTDAGITGIGEVDSAPLAVK